MTAYTVSGTEPKKPSAATTEFNTDFAVEVRLDRESQGNIIANIAPYETIDLRGLALVTCATASVSDNTLNLLHGASASLFSVCADAFEDMQIAPSAAGSIKCNRASAMISGNNLSFVDDNTIEMFRSANLSSADTAQLSGDAQTKLAVLTDSFGDTMLTCFCRGTLIMTAVDGSAQSSRAVYARPPDGAAGSAPRRCASRWCAAA